MGVIADSRKHHAEYYLERMVGMTKALSLLNSLDLLEVEDLATSGTVGHYGREDDLWDVPVHVYLDIPFSLKPVARTILFASGHTFKKRVSVGGMDYSPVLYETWVTQGLRENSVEIRFFRNVVIGEEINGCKVSLKRSNHYTPSPDFYPTLDCPRKGY